MHGRTQHAGCRIGYACRTASAGPLSLATPAAAAPRREAHIQVPGLQQLHERQHHKHRRGSNLLVWHGLGQLVHGVAAQCGTQSAVQLRVLENNGLAAGNRGGCFGVGEQLLCLWHSFAAADSRGKGNTPRIGGVTRAADPTAATTTTPTRWSTAATTQPTLADAGRKRR